MERARADEIEEVKDVEEVEERKPEPDWVDFFGALG
jgi:hypothetical protein